MSVGVLSCVVVEGYPNTPFSAALGLAAALGMAFFSVRASWIAVVGEDPRTPFLQRSAWPLRFSFFCSWAGCVASLP
jgi:hypothetical protein